MARACAWVLLALIRPGAVLADGVRVPLSIAVAETNGQPVVSADWLDGQVRHATRAFAPSSVCFDLAERRTLPPPHGALETRADRHALGALLTPGHANVFVVASLRDVDDPTLWRMGVHWRARGRHPGHFVIVAASAWATTLAHELGHFFGNPHVRTEGNLMSYEGRSDDSAFDVAQGRRIARTLRRFLRTRELTARGRCD